MGRQVQGVLNLINNRTEDGGFHCVPMADPTAWLQHWTGSQHWTAGEPEPNGRYVSHPLGIHPVCIHTYIYTHTSLRYVLPCMQVHLHAGGIRRPWHSICEGPLPSRHIDFV
jgi:hypothetical protein